MPRPVVPHNAAGPESGVVTPMVTSVSVTPGIWAKVGPAMPRSRPTRMAVMRIVMSSVLRRMARSCAIILQASAQARERSDWLRHLSMDFFENIHVPFISRQGMRRWVARSFSAASSMARYTEASFMVIMSLGVTDPLLLGLLESLGLSDPAQRLHLGLEESQTLHELLDSLGHRVGKVRLVQIDLTRDPLAVAVCYAAGHAHDNGVGRDLPHHDRAGADAAPVADLEPADDLGTRPDHDVVAEGGMALLTLEAGAAQRHSLQQGHVLTDLGRLPDHHTHAVIDEEARPELGRRVDLDPGQESREVHEPPRENLPAPVPQPMGGAVKDQHVHPGVAHQHFESGSRGRITFTNRSHVPANRLKHGGPPSVASLERRRATPAPPPRRRAVGLRAGRPARLRSPQP